MKNQKDTKNNNIKFYVKKDINRYLGENIILFDLAPIIIGIIDKTGQLLYINNKIKDWLGYTSNEVKGKNFYSLPFISKKNKSKIFDNLSQRSQKKEVKPYECKFYTKDSQKRFGKLYAVPLSYDQKGVLSLSLIVITDITVYKQTEEDLKNTQKEIKKIQKREKLLQEEISHRFLNPLCVAKGYLHLLKKTEFAQKQIEEISAITRAVDNIEKMVLHTIYK